MVKHDGDVDEPASNLQLDGDSSHAGTQLLEWCGVNQGIGDVEMTDDIVVARARRLLRQRGL